MRNLLIILIFLSTLIPAICYAQNWQSDVPAAQTTTAQTDNSPVAVPIASEKALSYYNTRNFWWGFGLVWGLLIPALFLFTGWSAKIRDVAQRLGKKWFFVIGLYAIIFTVITFFIDLPLDYFSNYSVEHQFGLSNQTIGKWLQDNFTNLAVGCVMSFLFLWIPYWLIQKSPQRWWLYTGLLAIPFIFLMIMVQPIWIEPLFNKFGPMKDKALETKILALAEKSGIEGSRVFEVAKSEDTKKVNAYVTGFMDTKRIVLWDTLTAKLDEKETLFVMGHEMGHYVLGHVWKSIAFLSLILLVTLYIVHRLANWMIAKYSHRFGFTALDDIASLPLLILLAAIVGLITPPIINSYTRYNEHEADRFGLEVTQNNHSAATAFVKLQQENLANPRPGWIVKAWRGSHPPLAERIEFSNDYKPWANGEPLKYGDLFKTAEKKTSAVSTKKIIMTTSSLVSNITEKFPITASGIGPIKLGVTLEDARKAFPEAKLERTSDGDGAALVAVTYRNAELMVLSADENDPADPIDWSKKINYVQSFNPSCQILQGLHPGSLIADGEKLYGKVEKITMSEIESRQYIDFERQPEKFIFRTNDGIFSDNVRTSKEYDPKGTILSIGVSH